MGRREIVFKVFIKEREIYKEKYFGKIFEKWGQASFPPKSFELETKYVLSSLKKIENQGFLPEAWIFE